MYRVPKLIDINAKSRLIRDKEKLLIIGRCVEIEHPWALDRFKPEYAIVSVCLEDEHVNHVGFKLVGVIARCNFKEVAVLTVDGSMHCTQLHYMIEEIDKILGGRFRRRHIVIENGELIEIPLEVIKLSRYLSKLARKVQR